MIFASKTPDDLTSKAAAELCARCEAEFREDGLYSEDEHRDYHQPAQHNEPNPILLWHRVTTRDGWHAVSARYVLDHWAATVGVLPDLGIIEYTKEHEDHARRVFARVANLAGEGGLR